MDLSGDVCKYTVQELWEIQARADCDQFELDEGELIQLPPTGFTHGRTGGEMLGQIRDYLKSNPIGTVVAGEVGFILSQDTVRAPDAAYLSNTRLAAAPPPEEGFYPGAPDLAVEVMSPNDSLGDLIKKVSQYLKAGTTLVWVLDPRRRVVVVFRADGIIEVVQAGSVLSGDPLLPGFQCQVDSLFPAHP